MSEPLPFHLLLVHLRRKVRDVDGDGNVLIHADDLSRLLDEHAIEQEERISTADYLTETEAALARADDAYAALLYEFTEYKRAHDEGGEA
jgi:hypothetical protein